MVVTRSILSAGSPSSTSRSESSEPFKHMDWALLAITAALAAAGILALYSERLAKGATARPSAISTVNKQGISIALGVLAMLTIMSVDYRKLRSLAIVFYGASAALLVAVRLAGQEINGAKAWFNLGFFQLQPSELAKVTLVFMLAAYCSDDRGAKLPYDRFIKALMVLGLPLVLVLAQPDLGTASTLVAITMGVLLVAKAPAKHIILVSLLSLATVYGVAQTGLVKPYQISRLTSFWNQEERLVDKKQPDGTIKKVSNKDDIQQVKYSKEAITLGRATGSGVGKGLRTSSGDVPFQTTDFIFSAIGEQFGLIGASVVLGLYLLLMLRCIRIAQIAPDHMGSLIAVGAATLLVWHVFENVGMNMGMMPVTGIPLPLVSFGGSSTLAFLSLLGLVQNVHMRRYTPH
jgi:rod shape determining protein RodA